MSYEDQNPYTPPAAALDGPAAALPSAGPVVTAAALEALAGTRPWTLFLAILGFVGAGFMVLAGLLMGLGALVGGSFGAGTETAPLVGIGVFYLLLAGIYVLIAVLLVRYPRSIGRLLATGRVAELEQALEAQRVFWKASGILVIVSFGLGLVAVIVVAVVAAAAFAAH